MEGSKRSLLGSINVRWILTLLLASALALGAGFAVGFWLGS